MQLKGPYVAMACFCERVLVEQDGTLSAIRIVDRVAVSKDAALPANAAQGIYILISLKSGDFKGSGEVYLQIYSPSEKPLGFTGERVKLDLRGEDNGHNVIIQTGVPLDEEGVYWFDVMFNDRLLTRMPVSVVLLPNEIATSPKAPSKSPQNG